MFTVDERKMQITFRQIVRQKLCWCEPTDLHMYVDQWSELRNLACWCRAGGSRSSPPRTRPRPHTSTSPAPTRTRSGTCRTPKHRIVHSGTLTVNIVHCSLQCTDINPVIVFFCGRSYQFSTPFTYYVMPCHSLPFILAIICTVALEYKYDVS